MAYTFTPAYPTPQHADAAQAVTAFFAARDEVQAVLLTGSCARGKATSDSCLDIAILISPILPAPTGAALQQAWDAEYARAQVYRALRQVGAFSHVDLDITRADFAPQPRGWTSGPDEFELEIGNTLVYSACLFERGRRLEALKAQWLSYYAEDLCRKRLAAVRRYCLNNLDHIRLYVARGLYFQSFHRLYDAYREFLQALFITRRIYPIAYDKWIREQIVDILQLPELYAQLPRLFEFTHFESDELAVHAAALRALVETFTESRELEN
jgi:predicted nucleotidyltransferase